MYAARCPHCGSGKMWKDGIRAARDGDVQRYVCRTCGYRFSPHRSDVLKRLPPRSSAALNSSAALLDDRQIRRQGAKNLATVEPHRDGLAGATTRSEIETNGKIAEYLLWLKKQGYADSTILGRIKLTKQLVKRGADLNDPETVKETIAKQDRWSQGRKELAVECYSNYLVFRGGTWDPPKYKRVERLPFIPTETELDQLIAGCGNKTGTFLQLLKETGARCGEAWNLERTDIDTVNHTIRITPEKHSHPRMIKVSSRLIERLTSLPNTSKKAFGGTNLRTTTRIFERSKKLIAAKTRNPRLLKITFHTFRHWKATMEYHRTKDILHVMRMLGHKNIKNTLVYTQLVDFNDEDYVSKVAWTLDDTCKLVEAGFEFVCDHENAKVFRKPK